MGEFIPLFPSILAVTPLGLEKSERQRITKFILGREAKFKKRSKDNVLFETSPMNLHKEKDMAALMNKIASALSLAIRNYGIDPTYLKLHVTKSWANLNLKTTVTAPHTHINSHLSVVYYPDQSCNQATINFLRPNSINGWIPGISHPSYSSIGIFKTTKANAETLSYSPKEDICLIFPSDIAHSVSPNPSHKPRISIAMDTLFTLQNYHRDEPLLPPPSDWREFPL